MLLFETWYMALIPPATFVVINALSYWRGAIKAMELEGRGSLGTIYFPIAFAGVIYYFWSQPVLMVASMMPMTWGDALAAILGRRYGQREYGVLGFTRSMEGSLAMFLFSWLSTFLALLLLSPFSWQMSLFYSLAVAIFATLVEALSPWHIDNLTVPLFSAALLHLIAR